jgi:hypothetical protein
VTYTLTARDLEYVSEQVARFPALSPAQSARLSTLLGGGRNVGRP